MLTLAALVRANMLRVRFYPFEMNVAFKFKPLSGGIWIRVESICAVHSCISNTINRTPVDSSTED
jgi:hypothetical protein